MRFALTSDRRINFQTIESILKLKDPGKNGQLQMNFQTIESILKRFFWGPQFYPLFDFQTIESILKHGTVVLNDVLGKIFPDY